MSEPIPSTTLPPLWGDACIESARTEAPAAPTRLPEGARSACAVALHMHQPLILESQGTLSEAKVIVNLEQMLRSGSDGERHDATVFHQCYRRMGEIVPRLVEEGHEPRIMLEYSGTLLHGLEQMGLTDVFDALRRVTEEGAYRHCVEWLGAPWGHAVAPSTPVTDYRLHVRAWQSHFAALFGTRALGRVRGFSPSEMALPNHPDVAFEFVKTLREAGYEWVLVQEHTVERADSGGSLTERHLPHRLVCRSSSGETASIVAIVKTQGSDGKLVGQMQPYYEALTLSPASLGGKSVPQLVTQIADGENGGVMMNEFPSKYVEVVRLASGSQTPLANVSEYLDELYARGVTPADLPAVQPILQHRIWERMAPGDGAQRLAEVLRDLSSEDAGFHVEGGSWTNDVSWVRGYGDLMSEMERASARYHRHAPAPGAALDDGRRREALFYLMCSQTSCFRYWGEGRWTDYGRELCRRACAALERA